MALGALPGQVSLECPFSQIFLWRRPVSFGICFAYAKDVPGSLPRPHRREVCCLSDWHAHQSVVGLPQMATRGQGHAADAEPTEAESAKGLLGVHTWIRSREVLAVQYWRSFKDLENFARHSTEPHLQVWKDFNQRIGSNGSVGIWHETYMVNAR